MARAGIHRGSRHDCDLRRRRRLGHLVLRGLMLLLLVLLLLLQNFPLVSLGRLRRLQCPETALSVWRRLRQRAHGRGLCSRSSTSRRGSRETRDTGLCALVRSGWSRWEQSSSRQGSGEIGCSALVESSHHGRGRRLLRLLRRLLRWLRRRVLRLLLLLLN